MSWCSCVSSVFVVASPDSAELMYQAALDCFVSCLPNPSKRLAVAEAIAAKLNLTKDKVPIWYHSFADFESFMFCQQQQK